VYLGDHQDDFQRLRYEVPILMRPSMIDIAVSMGLDFQEGWNHPLTVRFADGAPADAEAALAYVQLMSDGEHQMQRLNVNLAAYAKERFNFDKVFRHELFHAMLNDALGEDAMKVPVWVHEGMAVFAAQQGDQMINSYLSQIEVGDEDRFINGLDGQHTGADYVEDYLAIKYINDRHGVNSLHAFTRALITHHGDVNAAIEDACSERREDFDKNARDFALEELHRTKRTLRGAQAGPF
jgi:hypothetical protein